MHHTIGKAGLAGILLAVAFTPLPALAQTEYKARTASDDKIPIEELNIMLRPLSKEQLEVEAAAWFDLLTEKTEEIAKRELEIRKKTKEISEVKEKSKETATGEDKSKENAAVEEVVEDKAAEKVETAETLVKLREDKSRIMDRTNQVLSEWEKKGGDIKAYKTYIDAVSGIDLDVTDTDAAWTAIMGWIKSPEGGVRWGFNILKFVATIIAFWIVASLAARAVGRAIRHVGKLSNLLGNFIVTSVRRTILLVGLIIALSQLEVNIGPLVAAIGAAGFVVAFALQGTLSNFASGLLILIYRPYDVGDVIDAAGVSGSVKSMSLMSTTITTFDNKVVIVPNNSIWGGVITNVTGSATRRVDMVFGIGYSDDVDKAREIIEEVVKSHPLVLKEPEPVVRMHELADSSVNFICRPWSATGDYWAVYWDVTRSIKQRFDAEGISIPFPQRDVHVYQVNGSNA